MGFNSGFKALMLSGLAKFLETVLMNVRVFWNTTPCRLVGRYQLFGVLSCFHIYSSPRIPRSWKLRWMYTNLHEAISQGLWIYKHITKRNFKIFHPKPALTRLSKFRHNPATQTQNSAQMPDTFPLPHIWTVPTTSSFPFLSAVSCNRTAFSQKDEQYFQGNKFSISPL